MIPFSDWLLNELISDELAGKLRQLLASPNECAGYIRGPEIFLLNKGQQGNVTMGQADDLRSLDCDYLFHCHPRERDVPYPSGTDIVGIYMTGRTHLVVCQNGVWSVTPTKKMEWQEVERISNKLWLDAQQNFTTTGDEPYWYWKDKIKDYFPVQVERVHSWG